MEREKFKLSLIIPIELNRLLEERCKKTGMTKNGYIVNLLNTQLVMENMLTEALPNLEDKLLEIVKNQIK